MYSLNLKNGFAQLKRNLKKGIIKGRDALKRLGQEFDLAIDPNKTYLKYPNSYFPEINKILKENDLNFRRWRNWVIKKLSYIGFSSQYNTISINAENDGLVAFSFDFKKSLLYDPIEIRLLRGDRFGDDWWRSGGRGYGRYKVVWIDGSIGFSIIYKEKHIKTLLFIDYKEPLIPELDSTFIDGLKALSDQISKDFSLLLHSEFPKVEVNRIKTKIEKNVSDVEVGREISEIVDILASAESDIGIDQKEVDRLIKEIKDIPDIELQDELLDILEKMQQLEIEKQQKILKKIKKIIIEYKV
ncbi:MAG: hypothetical protein ACFFDB_00175 [Promethearchaeota archaeon]